MLIAQISDLHCREAGAAALLGADINGNIGRAVARLNALDPQPDVVIATGDLTSGGTPAQYAALDELLSPLRAPLYLLPGNHDVRAAMFEAFGGRYGVEDGDFVRMVIEAGPLRLVGLDTVHPGRHDGILPADRLDWLDGTLAAAPAEPALIFMHHPPCVTGVWWIDKMGILEGLEGLAAVLGRHEQVVGITAGHLHRTLHSSFAGIRVTVAPTTSYIIDLDLNDEAPPKVTSEPPGFLLHHWQNGVLTSHSLFLDDHETTDIRDLIGDWPARAARLKAGGGMPKGGSAIE